MASSGGLVFLFVSSFLIAIIAKAAKRPFFRAFFLAAIVTLVLGFGTSALLNGGLQEMMIVTPLSLVLVLLLLRKPPSFEGRHIDFGARDVASAASSSWRGSLKRPETTAPKPSRPKQVIRMIPTESDDGSDAQP